MRVLFLVLLVGCKLGFDPISPGDNASGDDASPGFVIRDAGPCDDAACSAAGGTCIGMVCEIMQAGEDVVTCPDGMACRIVCSGTGRPCRDGARCGNAPICDVRCIGYRACQYGVDCSGASCTVLCDGEQACESGISVASGGACTSHCCGLDACSGGVATCASDSQCN